MINFNGSEGIPDFGAMLKSSLDSIKQHLTMEQQAELNVFYQEFLKIINSKEPISPEKQQEVIAKLQGKLNKLQEKYATQDNK